MRKRWRWYALAGLGTALVALVVWPRPDRITTENFDRIKDGMSRGEVQVLFGCLPDYESSFASAADPAAVEAAWEGPFFTVVVCFDGSGRVQSKWLATTVEEDSLAQHLKRQWRRWFPE